MTTDNIVRRCAAVGDRTLAPTAVDLSQLHLHEFQRARWERDSLYGPVSSVAVSFPLPPAPPPLSAPHSTGALRLNPCSSTHTAHCPVRQGREPLEWTDERAPLPCVPARAGPTMDYIARQLVHLARKPENRTCADCSVPLDHTVWAVLPHGAFVCRRCSLVHGALGPEVSRPRALDSGDWTRGELDLVRRNGNRRVNEVRGHPRSRPPGIACPLAHEPSRARPQVLEHYIPKGFAKPGPDARAEVRSTGYAAALVGLRRPCRRPAAVTRVRGRAGAGGLDPRQVRAEGFYDAMERQGHAELGRIAGSARRG